MKVLLSTYNGEAWLDDLLHSVRAQTFTDWTMVVRDDASTDGSVEIVRAHARADARIQLVSSQSTLGTAAPLGAAESFFSLLQHVGADEPFAFCDQDDVWFPHKLEWSIEALASSRQTVAAVATDAEIVDAGLRPVAPSALSRHGFSETSSTALLGKLFLNNVVIGATMVGSGELAALARQLHLQRTVTDPVFHDWWTALVAAYAGELIILPAPTMAWRRHNQTVTGDTPAAVGGRADRRMKYLRWSIDSARTLTNGCEAVTGKHKEVAEALAMVDLTNSPSAAVARSLGRAFQAGVRPWSTKHQLGLLGSLGRNLRHRRP